MTTTDLPQNLRREMDELIGQLQETLATVIRETDTRIALPLGAEAALAGLREPLPKTGTGAAKAMERLFELRVMDFSSPLEQLVIVSFCRWNAEVFADFLCQNIFNFGMSGNSRAPVLR